MKSYKVQMLHRWMFVIFTGLVLFYLPLEVKGQVPDYVPTDSLVGWWPFNGNANDESGNGNHGVVDGATLTVDRFGNVNNAFDFNRQRITDKIKIDYLNNSNFSNDFTISSWVVFRHAGFKSQMQLLG